MCFKKFALSVVVIAMMLPVNSCKKYLTVNPVSTFGPDYVFSNVTNATAAVLGVYAAMTGDQGYGTRVSMYFPYDDDNIEGQSGTPFPDGDRRDIAHYGAQSSNAQLYLPFNQMFSGIERANLCIYYIPKMTMYNDATNGPVLKRLYGEALTLRAQFYLELIRNWGDVPAQFAPTFTQSNLNPGKTDRDTIYNHLLNDLLAAEQIVPWRTAANTPNSRITQGAVRALRARIAMYRAGWSFRSSGIMAQGSDPNTYYTIAKNECDTILTFHTADHSLETNFKDVFQKYLDAGMVDPTGEVLWCVTFGGGTGTTDSKLGYYDGPKYTPSSAPGNAALTILPSYFYLFDSTDLRRDVTIAPYDILTSVGGLTVRNSYSLRDGKFRRDWIPNGFPSTVQYFGASWPLIRLSDVYLMYAEADNELNNGASGLAIGRLMAVSARGHNNNTTLAVNPPADHDGFFKALMKERSLEFGGEGIRKYDLIRWNMLGTAIANAKNILSDMSTRTSDAAGNWANYATNAPYDVNSTTATGVIWLGSFYNDNSAGLNPTNKWLGTSAIVSSLLAEYGVGMVPGVTASNTYTYSTANDFRTLLPIPQAARDANPNLAQNIGY